MLDEILQEINHLSQDRKFVRNLGWTIGTTLVFSCSLATEYYHPERLTQQEKLEQFSELMSVGISIRSQTILTNLTNY